MNTLAIIPARGQSKRMPGKNGRKLYGKPLLAWSVEAALMAPSVSDVYFLTDSNELAGIATAYGAKCPYLRDARVSGDFASSYDVIEDFFRKVPSLAGSYTHFIYLQPTSPLRTDVHIEGAIQTLVSRSADSVISVCESIPPAWINQLPPNESMGTFLQKADVGLQSQQLGAYFRLNGAIYLSSIQRFLKERTWYFEPGSFAYKMSPVDSVDIDSDADFEMAEAVLRLRATKG